MSLKDGIGLACFFVLLGFVILGWRAGKRQFKAWESMKVLEGRNELAAELAAFAAGGSAQASQTVMVVQGDTSRTDGATSHQGRDVGGVLDRVPADVHAAHLQAFDLEAMCGALGVDPVEVYRMAAQLQPAGAAGRVVQQPGPGVAVTAPALELQVTASNDYDDED